MRIKCVNTDQDGRYDAVSVGKEYIVLAIEFYDRMKTHFCDSIGDFVLYRIRDDDGVVIPYPSLLFDIVSNKNPSCWVSFKEEDMFSILPNTWATKYFWDDYYNDVESALFDFLEAEKEIIASDF